jgi:hypothetical protein
MFKNKNNEEQIPEEIGGIPVVDKVKYLGVTVSTNRKETDREAKNSIRRNIALIKFKLRSAENEVKE